MSITTIPSVHKDLGNGHFMVSAADFDNGANKLRVHTDLTSTNKLSGFHGRVQAVFFGDHGQRLGTAGQDWGINQAPLFGASHRHIDFDLDTPFGTQGIGLMQFWHPHWPLAQLGDNLGGAFDSLSGFVGPNDFGQWLHQNAQAIEIAFIVIVVAGTVLCLAGVVPTCAVVLTIAA